MHADSRKPIWPISLGQIEETVSAHFGPGRISGNASTPCFSRQVSMYLAKHVGGFSLPKIGRFYNGRHHTTVLHAIAKIERLRKADEAFDSLLDILTDILTSEPNTLGAPTSVSPAHLELIEAVALRVIQHLKELPMNVGTEQIQAITNGNIRCNGRVGADERAWNYTTDSLL